MPVGLQTYNADSTIQIDLTGLYPKLLGSFHTGTNPGSVTDQKLRWGRPFAYLLPDQFTTPDRFPLYAQLSTTVDSVYWEFNPYSTATGASVKVGGTVIYGVY